MLFVYVIIAIKYARKIFIVVIKLSPASLSFYKWGRLFCNNVVSSKLFIFELFRIMDETSEESLPSPYIPKPYVFSKY